MEKKGNLNRVGSFVSLVGYTLGALFGGFSIFSNLFLQSESSTSITIGGKPVIFGIDGYLVFGVVSLIACIIGIIACINIINRKNAKLFTFVALFATVLYFAILLVITAVAKDSCAMIMTGFMPTTSFIGNLISIIGIKDVA